MTYPGPSTTGYVYDALGNRTSMTMGMDTTTYAYDDADRLTTLTPPGESAVTYTWDDNGNLTDRGSDEFEWDYEDRLVSATVDSAETTFTYRGDGLRESRTFNSNTVTFTWDIAAGLPVVIDDEAARYVYGAGLASQVTSSETYYYLADGLGSTMVTVDSDGDVVNSYTYDVFGETRSESGAQANEFQFAGQQVDGSTGLQYLRARYYDMETGRFTSRDPLAAAPGWSANSYTYGFSSPTNATDPLGLVPPEACGQGRWCFLDGSSQITAGPLQWAEYLLLADDIFYRLCSQIGEYKHCSGATIVDEPDYFTGISVVLEQILLVVAGTRGKLVRHTGVNPADSHAHHVFPRKFRAIFERAGININDARYLVWWEKTSHLKNARAYNRFWESFFSQIPSPTRAQILERGRLIMSFFGRTVGY